jgi:valyl-tRNA synthetase
VARHDADLARFYPGHTLVTAPEILYLWVARMLMGGYHFLGKLPFTTVYLTGTVRDAKHRKMSKSLGNGIDPVEVVQQYGADALRWTAVFDTSVGQDLILDHENLDKTFAPGRNFANKLWNIGRFILGQLPEHVPSLDVVDRSQLTVADRWILTRANETIAAVTTALEQFRLDEAAKRCYEFVWHELADWYVEAVKPRLGTAGATAAHAVLAHCFEVALRLLHPIVPFITEELWQKLPGRRPADLLAQARWPQPKSDVDDRVSERQFERVKTAIEHIRSIRAEYRISPKSRLAAAIVPRGRDVPGAFEGERETILRLAQLETLTIDGVPSGVGASAVFGDGSEVFVALEGVIDVQQECRRLSTEVERLDKQIDGLAKRLGNESFLQRAPENVIATERAKEQTWREQRSTLAAKLKALGC